MTNFNQSVKAGIGATFGVFLALAVPVMGAATFASVGLVAVSSYNIATNDEYLSNQENQWFYCLFMLLAILVISGDTKLALTISKYIKD